MVKDGRPTLGVGLVGYAFMGAVHSQAWRCVGRMFDLPVSPAMTALCGRDPDGVQNAVARFGWASVETDWRRLLERDDVHLVDICTPGDDHAELAIAALAAGMQVLCEKPLVNTVEEAVAMTAVAEPAAERGVRSTVGFNYRRVPARTVARRLVKAGRPGTIRHVRAQYLQDWIREGADPTPSFADGLQVQRVLAAEERSADNGSCRQQVEGAYTVGKAR
ncbi:Gfo/Idh/MocA family oxidoreductase [Streptomyces sp. PSKA28]|uniref:Gfo/Idh/MocA family oxidoreductase n=1 Tax=Streptomyces himalayensis subsp. himalayensis TaxID=2756131 RepID=A0A7W0DII0_9ACTN|nr:Gfo/Idh/MocA family oxidoreductase [Streptomyces himalayensis subsp. himalayensis]